LNAHTHKFLFNSVSAYSVAFKKANILPAYSSYNFLLDKGVGEIHLSVKLLKVLQTNIKFHWIPTHCCVLGNEKADYSEKRGTKVSQTSAFKLTFRSAKL
jgi:hypothetical protein